MDKPGEEKIAQAIEEILQRREFGAITEERQAAVVEQPSPGQTKPAETKPSNNTWGSVSLVVLFAIGVVIFIAALRVIAHHEKEQRLGADTLPKKGKSAELPDPLQSAAAHAVRGEYDAAVVCLFALHLKALQQQGWLVLEKSKTNLQYELELRQGGYDDLGGFRDFKTVFNSVRYGGYGVEQAVYRQWDAYCRKRLERRRAE